MDSINITDANKTINMNNNNNSDDNVINNNIQDSNDNNNNNNNSNDKNILNSNVQFFQKITVENFPSKEDLLYITENFFKGKNYSPQINLDNYNKRIIYFILDNEEFAYNFTK
jgi:hypothetical protein